MLFFSGDDTVYFGFMASTGRFSNLHQVCFNSISFVDDLQLTDLDICIGESSEIDATVANGVSYSWLPIEGVSEPSVANPLLSPTITTDYTVRISDVCGDVIEEDLQITVNPIEATLFEPVDPICEGEADFALPLTSLNGIMGVWTQALDNTITQTYTFLSTSKPCAEQVMPEVVVIPLEISIFESVGVICEGDILQALPNVSANEIFGTWSPQPNNLQTTTYTFTPDFGQCAVESTMTIEVLPISDLSVIAMVISDSFEDDQIVRAVVKGGTGDYEYQLDDDSWQFKDTIENITGCGPHVLRAREASGCGNLAMDDFIILEFPRFFSANGDNANELWNIECLEDQEYAGIAIYDRYGKLLSTIKPSGSGWDGTYNRRNVSSGDYWFTVNYLTD